MQRLEHEPALDARNRAMVEEKQRIARAALAELPSEGTILIDCREHAATLPSCSRRIGLSRSSPTVSRSR